MIKKEIHTYLKNQKLHLITTSKFQLWTTSNAHVSIQTIRANLHAQANYHH